MEKIEKISFEKITLKAEQAAREIWGEFISHDAEVVFRPECLHYERAWMFFRHPSIFIPENRALMDGAVVISDFGEVRHTVSYYPDLNACMSYLKIMSDHFKERGL